MRVGNTTTRPNSGTKNICSELRCYNFRPSFPPLHLLLFRCHLILQASPYPLILSLENHCSVEQQAVMARHLRSILGDKLLTKPLNEQQLQSLPSPEVGTTTMLLLYIPILHYTTLLLFYNAVVLKLFDSRSLKKGWVQSSRPNRCHYSHKQ